MRKKYLIPLALLLMIGFSASELLSNRGGAPTGRSGAPGEMTCATASCHAGNPNTGNGFMIMSSDATNSEYVPGVTYTVTISMEQASINRFGFEALVGLGGSGDSEGTPIITDATNTQLRTAGAKQYVTHTAAGTAGTNAILWSFDWTAPSQGTGDVIFYAAGNATNDNGAPTGDEIYTRSMTLTEGVVGIDEVEENSAQMTVFPSFTSETINFKMENLGMKNFELRLVNRMGQVVSSETLSSAGTVMHHSIDVSNLAGGMYYVQAIGEEIDRKGHFVKY